MNLRANNSSIKSRIINGENASIEEFPWMASIIVPTSGYCGGSIIHSKWILTAAHCVYDAKDTPNEIIVRVGSTNKLHGFIYEVKNVFVYYKYIENKYLVYDIALLELKNQINSIDSKSNSICLPKPGLVNNKTELAIFSGWGQTGTQADKPTNTLKKANYNILPNSRCKYTTNKFICVNESKSVTCSGDSGSALIQYVNCRYAIVIGVYTSKESYGKNRCGPALLLFTRVSIYVNWIQSHIDNKYGNGFETTQKSTKLANIDKTVTITQQTQPTSYHSSINNQISLILIYSCIYVILLIEIF